MSAKVMAEAERLLVRAIAEADQEMADGDWECAYTDMLQTKIKEMIWRDIFSAKRRAFDRETWDIHDRAMELANEQFGSAAESG